jgi:hypothetical protein
MSGVDELLGNLQAAGVLESHGTFTVDLRKAREKLQRYQLVTPRHYVLSLLSSAIGSGAKKFFFEKSGGECRVGFDGQPYTVDELKRLFENMVLGTVAAEPRLSDLGLAVQGARGLAPKFLEIESGFGKNGVRLSLESQTVTIEQMDEAPKLTQGTGFATLFRLVEGASGPWRHFKTGLGLAGQEEIKLLKRRARYAPCDVFLGDEKLNNSRLGPWTLAAKLVGGPDLPEFALQSKRLFPLKGDDTLSGYIGFGTEMGGWMIVDNGITFQISTDHSAYPTSRAVLFTKGLSRDLSGDGLVRNEPFQVLAGQVDKHLDSVVLRTNVDARSLSAEVKELLEPLLAIAKSRRAERA